MNKKLRKMLNEIKAKKAEIVAMIDEGRLEDAKTAKAELKNLEDRFEMLSDVLDVVEDEVKDEVVIPGKDAIPEQIKVVKNAMGDAVHEFANAFRHGFRNTATASSEGVLADGGYTVPQDIQTKINTLKEATFNLCDLLTSKNVTTDKGAETYRKRSSGRGFSSVGEGGKITQGKKPEYGRVTWDITKYGGYYPVTNELLADSDANITAELTKWIAEDDIATRNSLVISALAEATAVKLANLKAIKKAINVTLGAKFRGMITIVTNDDGLQWLDELEDDNGRPLLSANVNENSPLPHTLSIGMTSIPVLVVPNEVLPSTAATTTATGKIPFEIGAFSEYAKLFDRQKLTLKMSDSASVTDFNAFEEDLTLIRAIERLDIEVMDEDALVHGYIEIPKTTA